MKKIKEFILINLGLILVALGIYMFKIPNKFATGGVSGAAIIISKFLPSVNVGPLMLIINIVLIIAGLLFIGPNFASKTIYSSFALSGMVWLFQSIHALKSPLTDDRLLELMFSIVLPAVGSAIVFNQNASTGGTDIVAKILSRLTHIHIGKTLLLADFIIALMAGVFFGIKTGMYSILGLIMKGFIIDLVIEGLNVSKYMIIVSTKPKEVELFIVESLGRGATIYKAEGAYTREDKEVVTTVVSRRQAIRLRNFVREIDRRAFITITNTSEIIGKGFRNADL